MKLRKENILANVLLGTGVYLLDTLRDRISDNVSDISDQARSRAQDFIDTAQERASRASDVIRGREHRGLSTAAAVLIGVGIGVGVGMLLAPASGEETRENLADRVRDRFSREKQPSTGTYGV
jgi:gas vesicle protein